MQLALNALKDVNAFWDDYDEQKRLEQLNKAACFMSGLLSKLSKDEVTAMSEREGKCKWCDTDRNDTRKEVKA